ncbi:PREDICTED: GDSL esterase/lipase LIP-4-like [Ipomoea nil]|uniref:GDSL esterase/lipase LIP-4-like n=1 Tax=Ipomoea nil TaxID=35883 RepID=UPI0009018BE9|nr:PREDICTED: GDSL esterase/lipase LIP-4-like [Ipomoea nil]XP_019150922.1 PREDICTED: GDSL esterase/lipase LIP-4-like [Ipomoea nil]
MDTNQRAAMFVFITCSAFLVLSSPPLAAAECIRNPVIFNFGDSNSDTGGYPAAHGNIFGYPDGRTFFHRSSDRLCDGRLIIDFLCENVKADYLSPYLEALTPSFKNGVNFAIGGSQTLPKFVLFSLSTQLLQFNRFRTRSLEFHSKGTNGMLGEEDFENALYMIDIGQNDIAGAFSYLSKAQVIEKIPSFISEIKDAVWAIYKVGGRKFWVHNTGPVGCLPRTLATTKVRDPNTEFEETGCIKSLNEAAQEFNVKLSDLCEELRHEMKDATIVYVDIYTIKYNLISNSAIYGFENPLMACCGGGGAPYNANISCGQSGFSVCKDGSKYISWDGVHYTEDANAMVAASVLSTNYSTPPFNFDYFCSTNS